MPDAEHPSCDRFLSCLRPWFTNYFQPLGALGLDDFSDSGGWVAAENLEKESELANVVDYGGDR
jgi:hypothetical protein